MENIKTKLNDFEGVVKNRVESITEAYVEATANEFEANDLIATLVAYTLAEQLIHAEEQIKFMVLNQEQKK